MIGCENTPSLIRNVLDSTMTQPKPEFAPDQHDGTANPVDEWNVLFFSHKSEPFLTRSTIN